MHDVSALYPSFCPGHREMVGCGWAVRELTVGRLSLNTAPPGFPGPPNLFFTPTQVASASSPLPGPSLALGFLWAGFHKGGVGRSIVNTCQALAYSRYSTNTCFMGERGSVCGLNETVHVKCLELNKYLLNEKKSLGGIKEVMDIKGLVAAGSAHGAAVSGSFHSSGRGLGGRAASRAGAGGEADPGTPKRQQRGGGWSAAGALTPTPRGADGSACVCAHVWAGVCV